MMTLVLFAVLQICMKSGSDFYQEYLQLRTLVMQQDKAMVKGKLQR